MTIVKAVQPASHLPIQFRRLAFLAASALVLFAFERLYGSLLPNAQGGLGHDYSYFLPQLLAGYYWVESAGFLTVPWFTPAFCGGVPFFSNPQNLFFSVPQWLAFVVSPLTAVFLTAQLFGWIGFAGCYLLCRGPFKVSVPLSLLGGVLFGLNGFSGYRLVIGHLGFHAFSLVPLLAYLCLRDKRPTTGRLPSWIVDGTLAGLVTSYMVFSGMVHLLLPSLLSVAAIGLVHDLFLPSAGAFWKRLIASQVLGLSLGAAKLVAGFSFLAHFPRDLYPIPGARSLGDSLLLALQTLFWYPPADVSSALVNQQQWILDRHEFEYSVTLVPLLLVLLAGAIRLASRPTSGGFQSGPTPPRLMRWVLLVGILLLPIRLNAYSPAFHDFLKQIPLLQSTSTFLRWFAIYIPFLAVIGAWAFDRAVKSNTRKISIAAIGALLAVSQHALSNRTYYQNESFDAVPVVESFNSIDRGETQVPPVTRILGPAEMDGTKGLFSGGSPLLCYEPIFGYVLESFPVRTLHPGPTTDLTGGALNLKNPACYVFPAQNHCAPGDHFPAGQLETAASFASYRPFAFSISPAQKVANAVTALAFLLSGLLLMWGGAKWISPPI
jgi:hypothetical protein